MTASSLAAETIASQGQHALGARVLPGLGANLVSFTVDGTELLHWDEPAFLAGESFTGAFTMFPTPCRLANCAYPFEGRTIVQAKYGEKVFIHGLLRDEAMACRNEGDRVVSWLDIAPGHPVYEGFPFRCRFTVTHALAGDALTIGFALENRDAGNIPFGYGIHTYWRIIGGRAAMRVQLPCDFTLDLEQLVPTGGVTPVAGTPLDLRAGKTLDDFYIDNAFWPRRPGMTAELAFGALNTAIRFDASDNVPHMIVYAPESQPFVCVENLTSSPNAPNLAAAGHGAVANLLVAAPGETVEGWIRYTVAPPG